MTPLTDKLQGGAADAATAEQEQLRVEVHRLRVELAAYQQVERRARWIAAALTYGPSLASAVERWTNAYDRSKSKLFWRRIPRQESIDVIAAYLRARARNGLLIAACACIPGLVSIGLLWQQNKKMDQQTLLTVASQVSQLNVQLADVTQSVKEFATKTCIPEETLGTGVSARWYPYSNDGAIVSSATAHRPQCWADARDQSPLLRARWLDTLETPDRVRRNQSRSPRAGVQRFPVLSTSSLINIDANRWNTYRWPNMPIDLVAGASIDPSNELQRRSKALSEMLLPYRRVETLAIEEDDEEPRLSRPVSIERGALALAFAEARVTPRELNLQFAWLPRAHLLGMAWDGADLANAQIECAFLDGGSFRGTNLSGVRARGASFEFADLRSVASTQGAIFDGASFIGAILPDASVFSKASLRGAQFYGAVVPEMNWLEKIVDARGRSIVDASRVAYVPLPDENLPSDFRAAGQGVKAYWVIADREGLPSASPLASALSDAFTTEHLHYVRVKDLRKERDELCGRSRSRPGTLQRS